jgi:hypothetical protein
MVLIAKGVLDDINPTLDVLIPQTALLLPIFIQRPISYGLSGGILRLRTGPEKDFTLADIEQYLILRCEYNKISFLINKKTSIIDLFLQKHKKRG